MDVESLSCTDSSVVLFSTPVQSIQCAQKTVSVKASVERRVSARLQNRLKNEIPNYDDCKKESSDPSKDKVSRKKTKFCETREGNSPNVGEEENGCKIPEALLRSNEVMGSADLVKLGSVENGTVSDRAPANAVGKSAYARVKETIRVFNTHYLHFVQEEEKRCKKVEVKDLKIAKGSKSKKGDACEEDIKRSSKRPDLKAITKMMETKAILYPGKRFGQLPGIDVGHQFFSRAEMVAVGFHSHWLNGIDYMGQSYKKLTHLSKEGERETLNTLISLRAIVRSTGEERSIAPHSLKATPSIANKLKMEYSGYTFPLAVAIVLSGQYEDDLDNSEDVVYTGQGGNNLLGNKRQVQDQVMDRGNLALKNSMEQCVPVRVIRGHGSASSYCGKVYTYDGLYKVVNYWAEKGVSGFTVFKYRLRRIEGQPILTTNQVHFSRGHAPRSFSEIRGLVCEDISGDQEDIHIPATNLVDDPPVAPTGYSYSKSIQVSKSVKLPMNATGCDCKGTCVDPKTCACARLNGSDFPYVRRDGGRLIEAKAVVFECGPKCGCGPGCVNRTSQRGSKYRLEVFRTPKKGWAVRSWDYIPSGAPICEYTGVLMRTDEIDNVSENNFIFEIDCLQTMKGLDGRERRLGDVCIPASHPDKTDDNRSESVPEFCIDAGSIGNVARFINHSCEPNLFVQCVLSSHHDVKLARVVLFAADNIPPLQELTYDYGYALDSVIGPDGKIKEMLCYCGAADCRKRLH